MQLEARICTRTPILHSLKVQCLKVCCYHGNKSTILLFIQFLEQLLKFLVNFTLLKYVKSQRSYGFLITKELIFGFQILDLKVHFSASKCTFYVSSWRMNTPPLLFSAYLRTKVHLSCSYPKPILKTNLQLVLGVVI